jgi:hypothetical protein
MEPHGRRHVDFEAAFVISLFVLLLAASIIHVMGRQLICNCGYVTLWDGGVADPEVSQHFPDWYTVGHIVHGIPIYAAMWLIAQGQPSLELGLLINALFAAAWEVTHGFHYCHRRGHS